MKREHVSECAGCKTQGHWLLHNIRRRDTCLRYCTDCLLKMHRGFFCPFCFQVYEESDALPAHQRLMCHQCPSISHLSCLPPYHPHSPSSFLCPSCSNANFSFVATPTVNANNPNPNATTLISKDSAKALVAAAKIAAICMTKAAADARLKAEESVKEVALAKKRAREALERLAYLAAKERDPEPLHNQNLNLSNKQHRIQPNANKASNNNGNHSVCPVPAAAAANRSLNSGRVLSRLQSPIPIPRTSQSDGKPPSAQL